MKLTMERGIRKRPSTLRLFATYAVVSLVPVVVLGVVLALALTHQAKQRGLAEGRSQALVVAQTAIEPQLNGELLRRLRGTELRRIERITRGAVRDRHVLRLRLRDLAGRVVYSDDGSGFGEKPEDEAVAAASGQTVARLTRLNQDVNDTGAAGVSAVEVYLPLQAGDPARTVGVFEVYLPYAPISKDVTSGLHTLYLDLGVGLAVLYLILFAITVSVSRGLRREAAFNAFLAEYDTLTELPNRTLFHRRAEQAVARSAPGRCVALAIVDLDRFKEVNDTLGHQNGDLLLTELARRVAAVVPAGDTAARLGGDEFGLILRDVSDAESVLRRIREVIEREVEVSGLPLSIEASIGYVMAPEDGTDADTLLQRADVAMYAAKEGHAGVMRYDAGKDRFDAGRLSLVSELRTAIDAGELVLHYQPQANLLDRGVAAVEALVRWQHPRHGLLYPDSFLPLAEQTDVIDKLTAAVIRTAARQLLDLGAAQAELRVAVNVSARNLVRGTFPAEVLAILEEVGLPPERLIVEVTETALLADPLGAAAVLRELSEVGVSISLDDFGRGQTSLAYLSALPLDELKIDRSFVSDMLHNKAHDAIVRSIVDLGHNLGLHVVAEGVETGETLAGLRSGGCDVAQGYLLARPMPFDRLAAWLSDSSLVTGARGPITPGL